jgi:hypothetical protein
MSHASRAHRALDVAQAEALARDRERVDEAADRQRLAADRDADLAYRAALAASGDRFRDVADPGGALVPSKTRLRDARSLSVNRPRVLLTKLSVRTSAKGREYLEAGSAKPASSGSLARPTASVTRCGTSSSPSPSGPTIPGFGPRRTRESRDGNRDRPSVATSRDYRTCDPSGGWAVPGRPAGRPM